MTFAEAIAFLQGFAVGGGFGIVIALIVGWLGHRDTQRHDQSSAVITVRARDNPKHRARMLVYAYPNGGYGTRFVR